MSKNYILETGDETQLILEIGVNSAGATVITTHHASYLTPYEEPDLDAVRNEAYEKGVQDTKQHWVDAPRSCAYKFGYENGLNDAWDAARKIVLSREDGGLFEYEARKSVFGCGNYMALKNYSASEAVKKIRQYGQEQEEQIQVGDEVVFYNGEKCVVTVVGDGQAAEVMDKGGFSMRMDDGLRNSMKKTGRHFPEIVEVFKKMNGES